MLTTCWPSTWLQNQTRKLLAELQRASPNLERPINVVNDGINNGTYVAELTGLSNA